MVVGPLTGIMNQIPKSALIAIIGNPFTYSFHVGLELIRRAYLNFSWYIFVNDVTQRYSDTLKRYGIVKDDVTFINDLCSGVGFLGRALGSDGNLAYIIANSDTSCIEDYFRALMSRDLSVDSVAVIQVDENHHKPVTYIADLIIKLSIIEDPNSLKTISRVAKFILTRGDVAEVSMSYSVTPSEVVFKEFTRL